MTASIQVVGVFLIDSPYVWAWKPFRDQIRPVDLHLPEDLSPRIRECIHRRMAEADRLLNEWEIPSFTRKEEQGLNSRTPRVTMSSESRSAHTSIPPVILLRASEAVAKSTLNKNQVVAVDISRNSPYLGWEMYPGTLIQKTYNIPGNHYNLFDNEDQVRSYIC